MKKLWILMLFVLMLLTSCAVSSNNKTKDNHEKSNAEELESPNTGTSEESPAETDEVEKEQPIDYETVELPTLNADGDALVLDTTEYQIFSFYSIDDSPEDDKAGFENFKEKYHWYGVSAIFPFTDMFWGVGMLVTDGKESTEIMQDAIAMKVANKYYCLALSGILDESENFVYESNYPQFCSDEIGKYRWAWDGYNHYSVHDMDEWTFNPLQPKAYTVPIEMDVAELNWYMYGYISKQYCIEHGIDYCDDDVSYQNTMVVNSNAYTYWDNASLAEKTLFQDQYMKYVKKSMEEQYCAISGMTILNGDSRTEESYFAGSRAKNIRITINDEYVKELRLADTPAPQLIDLDYVQHTIAKPVHIEIEVLDSYAGTSDKVYITEIGVGIDSSLPQGLC